MHEAMHRRISSLTPNWRQRQAEDNVALSLASAGLLPIASSPPGAALAQSAAADLPPI